MLSARRPISSFPHTWISPRRSPREKSCILPLISARGLVILRIMLMISTTRAASIRIDKKAITAISWLRVALISDTGRVASASQFVVLLFLNMAVYLIFP